MKRTQQRRLAAFERAENKKAAPRKGRNKIPLWAPAEARTLSAADVFEMTREADKLMSAAAAWRGQAGGDLISETPGADTGVPNSPQTLTQFSESDSCARARARGAADD